MTKCIFIINTISLAKTFKYQTSFIPVYSPIRFLLNFEYPFTINYIVTFLVFYKMPCLVPLKCHVFFLHSLFPFKIIKSFGSPVLQKSSYLTVPSVNFLGLTMSDCSMVRRSNSPGSGEVSSASDEASAADPAGVEDPPGAVGAADSGGCSAPRGDGGAGVANAGKNPPCVVGWDWSPQCEKELSGRRWTPTHLAADQLGIAH